MIDLTHPVSQNLNLQWPTANKFNLTNIFKGITQPGGFYYETNEFEQSEHSGTHTDAPSHFYNGAWRVGEIPFERLSGPVVVINIFIAAKHDPDKMLELSDLYMWENQYGLIPNAAIVVMFSGYRKFYVSDQQKYLGRSANVTDVKDVKHLHFPGFHPDAVKWLINNRSIIGICVDIASVDPGNSVEFLTHRILGANNIWSVENTANVHLLPAKGFTIMNMVHRLQNGSGAPSRIVALLPFS